MNTTIQRHPLLGLAAIVVGSVVLASANPALAERKSALDGQPAVRHRLLLVKSRFEVAHKTHVWDELLDSYVTWQKTHAAEDSQAAMMMPAYTTGWKIRKGLAESDLASVSIEQPEHVCRT